MRKPTGHQSRSIALLTLLLSVLFAAPAWGESVSELRDRADAQIRAVLEDRGDRLLVEDRDLGEVARWAASETLLYPVDAAAVRHRLWAEDVRDFEFLPLVVSARDPVDPVEALAEALGDRSVRWGRYNTMAVAAARRGDRVAVAVLLTRRSAAFVPAQKDAGTRARIPSEYSDPVLYATRPDGLVDRRDPVRRGEQWQLDVSTPLDGAWLFELMATGPLGPEVLALWPAVQQRRQTPVRPRESSAPDYAGGIPTANPPDPTEQFPDSGPVAWSPYAQPDDSDEFIPPDDSSAWVEGSGIGPDRAPTPADAKAAEERLWALISATRRSRGLVPLRLHRGITAAARGQARELTTGTFGHHTASGTALDRLGEQGLTAARATENIARASDVAEAHAALMASPAHRANLLDPDVTSGGVGVVLSRDASGRWSAVVSEVFASLLSEDGEGADWEGAMVSRIGDRRRTAGLKELLHRDTLDKMARAAAQELVDAGDLRLEADRRRELAEEVRFHFMNARNVGIDLVVTAEPRAVDRVAHATDERFTELGVGIIRLPERIGDHSAGTLVVVLLFVER